MLVFVAFALKCIIVAAVARLLRPRCPDDLGAALAAWIVVSGLSFAVVFALSGAGLLTRPAFWIVLGAGAVVAAITLRGRIRLPSFAREGAIPLAVFGLFLLAFALRALLFPDFEPDAQTYGLVRVALWMNYETVFIHMPSPQVNVFANEWNGELLGLFYGLATGNLQGLVFANVDVLLFTYFCCGWLARRLGASWPWAFAMGGLAALCPACLGLATTVKGDLLAVGGFVAALGWLSILRAERDRFSAIMLTASLALAVGAKITAIFPALALAALAVLCAPRPFLSLGTVASGGLLAAVFLARYVANAFVYGDPIKRVAAETANPGLSTLFSNLAMIWRRSFEFSVHEPGGPQFAYALAGGLGVSGFALVAAIAVVLRFRRRLPVLILVTLAAGVLIGCFVVPSHWWGLRYFLPPVIGALAIVLAISEPRRSELLIPAVLIVTAVNISYLVMPGALNGNGPFARAFQELMRVGPIERTFLAQEERGTKSGFHHLKLDRPEPMSFAIFQDLDRPILPFVGSRAQNRVYLAGAASDIPRLLAEKRPDFAVITRRTIRELPKALRDSISGHGYVWVEENDWFAIASRADRPEVLFPRPTTPIWRSGFYDAERFEGMAFRWVRGMSEIRLSLVAGEACLMLKLFDTGRRDTPQIVKVEGSIIDPLNLDLAGATIRAPKQFLVPITVVTSPAQLRFVATMPEVQFSNDARRVAFGIVTPFEITNPDICRLARPDAK